MAQAARTDSNVYIEGESGTGKELIAKPLHVASARKDGPLVAINCAAIPENLFESELFGHKKGAFTGAAQNKEGLLSQADGGTFFLDEISEMPLSMQAKTPAGLAGKGILSSGWRGHPEGGCPLYRQQAIAYWKNPSKKGNSGRTLFYRIHVIVLKIPPLRERKEDIPLLAKFFFNKKHRKNPKKRSKGLPPRPFRK